MRRTSLVLAAATCAALGVVLAAEPEDKNIQRTVPTIVFITPDVKNTSLYSQSSPMTLQGNISRPLGWKQWIDFRIYHVLESGELYSQGGGALETDEQGAFGGQFLPPAEGWKPGALRVYGRVNSYPGVTGMAEIKIADQGFKPLKPEWRKKPALVDSGVVIDTDDPQAKEFFMPPSGLFRIRGEFFDEERFRETKAEILSIKIVRRLPDGTLDNVICEATGSRMFRDTDGQDDKPWFEIEMEAPPQPGKYHLTIETFAGEKRTTLWGYDLHLENEQDEKDDDKKND